MSNKSLNKMIKYVEDAGTSEQVDYIMKRLGHGATSSELIVELKLKFKITPVKAKAMIDTCTDVAFRMSPEYVSEIAGQIRHSIGQTLQGLDTMLEQENSATNKKELLRLRLQCLQSLLKLLPTNINIGGQVDDLSGVLFDLHGIEKKED
jgi:hypothetical protein